MTARLSRDESLPRVRSRSRLAFDCVRGRTRLAVSDMGAPLRVMNGFELEDGRLLVQIISAAPGFFAGDRYELTIEVAEGARAVILTPAAAKIHAMPSGGMAVQSISARVAPDSSLEIYPTLSIPFAHSDFEQRVEVAITGDGRFGWIDPWAFGRIESGERHAYRRISTRLKVDRDGKPAYRDALELTPASLDVTATGALEHATHALSGFWLGPCEPWEPRGSIADTLAWGILGADGLFVRGLFGDGRSFRTGLDAVRRAACTAWGTAEISQVRFTL